MSTLASSTLRKSPASLASASPASASPASASPASASPAFPSPTFPSLACAALACAALACNPPKASDTPPAPGASSAAVAQPSAAPAASTATPAASAAASAADSHPGEPPAPRRPSPEQPRVAFADLPGKLDDGACERVIVTLIKGKLSLMAETLAPGDSMVMAHPEPSELKGTGLAVVARARIVDCVVKTRPAPQKKVIRASDAPALRWAKGSMEAHLDTPPRDSPELYSGRLAGTAPVAEHTHEGTWEIIAAIEASGAFTLEGKEQRLGPRQIVFVPPGARHSWKPDANSKLVAVQMYSPPGPEQRFVALAQKEAAPSP